MASRRMFALSVVSTDSFLNLSHSAQALYFQLGMKADDDGVVDSPMSIMRMLGCKKEHLEELEKAGFIIPFPSGISVIRHWKLNNYLQNDRHHDTAHPDEFSQLTTDSSKRYVFKSEIAKQAVSGLDASCIQPESNMYTQVSIDKNRLDQNSLEKDSLEEHSARKEVGKGYGENIEEGARAINTKRTGPIKPYPKHDDFVNDEEFHKAVNNWFAEEDFEWEDSETETRTTDTANSTDSAPA